MKGLLEKLVGREAVVRTLDSAEFAGVVREVYDDAFLAALKDGSLSLVPFAAVASVSFA